MGTGQQIILNEKDFFPIIGHYKGRQCFNYADTLENETIGHSALSKKHAGELQEEYGDCEKLLTSTQEEQSGQVLCHLCFLMVHSKTVAFKHSESQVCELNSRSKI